MVLGSLLMHNVNTDSYVATAPQVEGHNIPGE